MAEIIDVANAMFGKSDWNKITDDDKEKFFFIFNRYFSKKYPNEAQLLNLKTIDKVVGMNLLYHFMKGKPYPTWFWSKGEKIDKKSDISESEFKSLLVYLKLKREDIEYLVNNFPDFIKSELKQIKDFEKLK